jgi:ubiquinone/menaquinone biosynthesis C-methylase UbiE
MKPVWVVLVLLGGCTLAAAQETRRNIWPERYKSESVETIAAEFEASSRPVYRYRAAMAGLMQLKPGMRVADIGAGSGFFARTLAGPVGPEGHVYATELEPAMVAHIAARATELGLANLTAVQGTVASTGLEDGSIDAAALIATYAFLDRPEAMLASIARALRGGGLLLIVDVPQTGEGPGATGVEAEDVIAAAKAAGFVPAGESAVVPGHYALRFRVAERAEGRR